MDTALLVARLLLAAVFGTAALAKLADRAGSERSVTAFGLPRALATPLGVLLPLVELAAAALLIPVASAWWGALLALALLLAFTTAIGANLAHGRRPECHCFGQLHSEPASWRTVARNGVLAAVAGFLVWQGNPHPGPSAVAGLGGLSKAQVILFVVGLTVAATIAAQAWLLVQLMRQHGRLLLRMDALESTLAGSGLPLPARLHRPATQAGLPVGATAPAFQLPDLDGKAVSLNDVLSAAGTTVLLVFVDPGCGPCAALAPELARLQQHYASRFSMTLISRGTADENRAKLGTFDDIPVLLQADGQVAEAYEAHGTPAAVTVDQDGRIASPLAMGADQIRLLVRMVLPSSLSERQAQGEASPAGRAIWAATPKLGEAAPLVELPDLAGKTISLDDFRGHRTALLFWHPRCGHCARMLPELRQWQTNRSDRVPDLLIISGGEVEANRAMGLQAPVVLDQAFAVGRAVGARGTPSAVLVDEDGRISSAIAVGAAQVLALLADLQ